MSLILACISSLLTLLLFVASAVFRVKGWFAINVCGVYNRLTYRGD